MQTVAPAERIWHVTIRLGPGSPEHFHHFLLGFFVPLVSRLSTVWTTAPFDRVLVRSCGPLDRLIEEFGDPRIRAIDKTQHLEIGRRDAVLDQIKIDRFVTIRGCDYPAQYDGARFSAVRNMLLSKRATAAARQQWEERWPSQPPRILLIERGASHPFYHSVTADNKQAGADRRSIANHEELHAALRAAFPGCLNVLTEALTLTDQVALFSMADVIIAQHGAALANMIWARPSTTVIEVFPKTVRFDQRAHDFFRYLAWCMGLRYRKVWQATNHSDVDIDRLRHVVDKVIDPSGTWAWARQQSFKVCQPALPAVYLFRFHRLLTPYRIKRRLSGV